MAASSSLPDAQSSNFDRVGAQSRIQIYFCDLKNID